MNPTYLELIYHVLGCHFMNSSQGKLDSVNVANMSLPTLRSPKGFLADGAGILVIQVHPFYMPSHLVETGVGVPTPITDEAKAGNGPDQATFQEII